MGRKLLFTFVVLGLLIAASCGGTPTSDGGSSAKDEKTGFEEVFKAIEGLEGKERTDKLVELAQEEGQFSLYGSETSEVMDELAGAFEDAYDLDVALYRADSETVLQRLVEEQQAQYYGADAVQTNGKELFRADREKVLVPYRSPDADALVEGTDFGSWTATHFNTFVVSWNTDQVSPEDAPTSWEELADPKWAGRIAMEVEDVDWYKSLWEYWVNEEGKSPEEADQLFEQIARNSLFFKGHTVIGELTAAGEVDVAASNYGYIVGLLIRDGAPVEWQPAVEPTFPRPSGTALVRGSQHPAAATLYVDWMMTEGEEILAGLGLDAAREDLRAARDVEEVIVDLESLINEEEEWTDKYQELSLLGKAGES